MKVVIGTNFFGDGLAANLQASFPRGGVRHRV